MLKMAMWNVHTNWVLRYDSNNPLATVVDIRDLETTPVRHQIKIRKETAFIDLWAIPVAIYGPIGGLPQKIRAIQISVNGTPYMRFWRGGQRYRFI